VTPVAILYAKYGYRSRLWHLIATGVTIYFYEALHIARQVMMLERAIPSLLL
jgi:hypothetical protein